MLILRQFISKGIMGTLIVLTFGAFLAIGMEYWLRNMRNNLLTKISNLTANKLSTQLFHKISTLKYEIAHLIKNTKKQELINSVCNLQQLYNKDSLTTLLDIPFSSLFIFVIFIINLKLGFLCLICMGTNILLNQYHSKKLAPLQKQNTPFSKVISFMWLQANPCG